MIETMFIIHVIVTIIGFFVAILRIGFLEDSSDNFLEYFTTSIIIIFIVNILIILLAKIILLAWL